MKINVYKKLVEDENVIATNIILSHGGTLELNDSPMKGLRVKLTLPV